MKSVYRMLFGVKKQWLILWMIGLIVMSFIIFIDHQQTWSERLYDVDLEVGIFQSLSMQSMFMMFPFIGLLIAFDHDQPFMIPLMTYKGRLSIIMYQFLIYLVMIILCGFTVTLGYAAITLYFFKVMLSYTFLFDIWLALSMDTMVLMILFMISSTHHQKIKAFIILMGYVIAFMMMGDHQYLLSFYLLPLGYDMFDVMVYAYVYKLLYVCFFILIFFYHKSSQNLSSF